MKLREEWKPSVLILGTFVVLFWLPIENARFDNAVIEALRLARWYAREHVLLCLVPAFFIAGAISVFVSQEAVMKYLGAQAKKILAYGVASVSGSVLAVCSCTVLPLFAGIYKRGAGLGPATAFLYSGPAINVLAIILTARVLGIELGIARAAGAVVFSVVIGLLMALIFHKEEKEKAEAAMAMPEPDVKRPLWKNTLYFATMIAILVFANWARSDVGGGIWYTIYSIRWVLTGLFSLILLGILVAWFEGGEMREWLDSSWGFAKQIMPLLLAGVLTAGFLLGSPGGEGIIPSGWVALLVGGNSVEANFFASVAGAFMYFATLTEVPILQGLISAGMGKGPALALLLAGPALSLPNMLVIRSVMGTKKTLVYIALVVVMATVSGLLFGILR